jgi:hypothetical protein
VTAPSHFKKTSIQIEASDAKSLKKDDHDCCSQQEAIGPIEEAQCASLHFHAMERCHAVNILFWSKMLGLIANHGANPSRQELTVLLFR